MAYAFSANPNASIKISGTFSGREMTISKIAGDEDSADTIVGGIEGLMYLAGVNGEGQFYPTEMVRTVKQNVIDSE